MNGQQLLARLKASLADPLPLPGRGRTAERHQRLLEAGRFDLSFARLAEAHWDAVAILAEAGRPTVPGAVYGVWASEIPGAPLAFSPATGTITGKKMYCSGAGLIDRALVTVGTPEPLLFEIDLRRGVEFLRYDHSAWKAAGFAQTHTSTVCFSALPASLNDVAGEPGWYLRRPGFWHGACGPAACWAGGALGLVDYASQQSRADAHTLAHLGAMHAAAWALRTYLDAAGNEIDRLPCDVKSAHTRALMARHLVEQVCTDILRRLPRAYGPRPLTADEEVSMRYQELDIYLRQSHAERDLESLGRLVTEQAQQK